MTTPFTETRPHLPCVLCGTPVYGAENGKGWKAGKKVFATCHGCTPKFVAGAQATGRVIKAGAVSAIRTVLAHKAPKALAFIDAVQTEFAKTMRGGDLQ
jgi:hypothetical protein